MRQLLDLVYDHKKETIRYHSLKTGAAKNKSRAKIVALLAKIIELEAKLKTLS